MLHQNHTRTGVTSSHRGDLGPVIERVYDSACDPSEWPTTLDALASSFGSLCATYFMWRKDKNALDFFLHSSDYGGDDLYRAHYCDLDPRRKLSQRLPESGILRCHDHLDEAFIRTSEFYQDFSIRHDRRFLMSTHIVKTDAISLYAVLHRTPGQGCFTDDDTELLRGITPHLRRAAQIQAKLAEVEAAKQASDLALDQLTFGILTVDCDGRVLSVNSVAEEITAERDGLALRRGVLVAGQTSLNRTLLNCIRRATEPGDRDGPRQGATLLVPRPSGRNAYRVLVAPLSTGAKPPLGSGRGGVALVMVRDPDVTSLPAEPHLMSLFGLTQAEAHITLALLEGKRLEDVAEERLVSMGTVRSQLKSILRKTGTDRQAELMRAILAVPVVKGYADRSRT